MTQHGEKAGEREIAYKNLRQPRCQCGAIMATSHVNGHWFRYGCEAGGQWQQNRITGEIFSDWQDRR